MRGHIAKKGQRYYPVVDLGERPAQRCADCGKRAGWIEDERRSRCPKCGGSLQDRLERRRTWHPGHARQKDAKVALTDLLSKLDHGELVVPAKATLKEFLRDEWLPAMATRIRPATLLS